MIEYDGRDEETLAESLRLIAMARQAGLDFVSVSMGFSTPDADIPWGPAFMAPIAGRIRREGGLPGAPAGALACLNWPKPPCATDRRT